MTKKNSIRHFVYYLSAVCWFFFQQAVAQLRPGTDRASLVVLDPSHLHGVMMQQALKQAFREEVYVYASYSNDLEANYMQLINRYNKADTSGRPWQVQVYTGDDYLERMLQDKKGEVVIMANNNQQKTGAIRKAAAAGLAVIADKPMALTASGFALLQEAFAAADRHGQFVTDLPAMSMRKQVTCLLQKELVAVRELFGTLEKGSPENPAVVQENLHYYYKGAQRPTWFFDVEQQGDGVTDVTTHLADLVLWTCFPEQRVRFNKDVRIVSAKLWPTIITPAQFEKTTRTDAYPDFLMPYRKDSVLEVFSNGEILSVIKKVHVRLTARWEAEPPAGKSDTHYSMLRGTRAALLIRTGQPSDLYIEPVPGIRLPEFEKVLLHHFERLKKDYPFISLHRESNGWRIASKKRMQENAAPAIVPSRQEVDRMLAKYYITTQANRVAVRGGR